MSQKLFINTQTIKPNSIPANAMAKVNDKISQDIFIKHVKLSGAAGSKVYTYVESTFNEDTIKNAILQGSRIFTCDKNDKGEYKTVVITDYNTDDQTITFSDTLNSKTAIDNKVFLIYFYDAVDLENKATGESAHAEGVGNEAIGLGSHAEGYGNKVVGSYSHAEGMTSKLYGFASHAEGNLNITSPCAPYSHVEGIHCVTDAPRAHAEGYGTTADGENSHAEGRETSATGYTSHAEGEYCKSTGSYSHAEGKSNTSSGSCSHAEGCDNKVSGYVSHVEGRANTTSGRYSHAEGWQTKSEGDTSHAEGRANTASGTYAHAEGYKTLSSGQSSHSEGRNTQATANGAHAEGNGCIADGTDSHAEGKGTQTFNVGEHACGKYNISEKDETIFSVGIGTSDTDRRNAITVIYPENPDHYSSLYLGTNMFQLDGFSTINNGSNIYKVHAYIKGVRGTIEMPDIYINGDISYAGSCTQISDERLKTFKNDVDVDLDKLYQLRKSYFEFNDKPGKTHMGVSAQELQQIYPELVVENKDGYLSVDYVKLSVVSLKAIDKFYEKNKELEDRLYKIERMLNL